MSSSDQVAVYMTEETAWGTTPPAGDLTTLRRTGGTFSPNDTFTKSPEVRSDRMLSDQIHTDRAPQGTIDIALSLGGTYDTLFEHSLCASAVAADSNTGSLTVVQSTGVVTMTGAFANAVVGQWFKISGSAANDGYHRIATWTDNDNVVVEDNSVLTDATAEASVTIDVSKLFRNGATLKSATYVEYYSDEGSWMVYRGHRIAQAEIRMQAQQILQGTFSTVGGVPIGAADPAVERVAAQPTTGSIIGATTTDILNAIRDILKIDENGANTDVIVNQFSLSVNNAPRPLAALRSLGPAEINLSTLEVTGALNAYFSTDAEALIDRYLAVTASKLSVLLEDGAGNGMITTIPNLRYTKGTPEAGGQNTDVPVNFEFAAMRDPTTDCMVQFDVFNV